MANNRLYLIIPGDDDDEDQVEYVILLAKGFGNGWDTRSEVIHKLIDLAMSKRLESSIRESDCPGAKTSIYVEDENHASESTKRRIPITERDLEKWEP